MPARDESRKGNDLGAELCVGIPGQGRHGHDAEVLGVLGEHLDYDDKSFAGKHVGPVSVRWVRFPVEAAVAQATGFDVGEQLSDEGTIGGGGVVGEPPLIKNVVAVRMQSQA